MKFSVAPEPRLKPPGLPPTAGSSAAAALAPHVTTDDPVTVRVAPVARPVMVVPAAPPFVLPASAATLPTTTVPAPGIWFGLVTAAWTNVGAASKAATATASGFKAILLTVLLRIRLSPIETTNTTI
ncbi:MAG TPA: hypothetical protein PKA47_08825 [Accumulibacter sp.]|nr:hypothetical protein [Accumulibacter sp.]